MLGDRLFLDRKLFKFSFSSDDLGGTQSTHVELKSRRDLAINGDVSWGPQAGHEILPTVGEECGVWGMGSPKSWSGGREFPMGLLGGVEVISFLTGLWCWGHLVASDDLS